MIKRAKAWKQENLINALNPIIIGYWRFSVADNGPGIDEKYYRKIFQTLKPRDEVESTGAGLTITRKIVRMHGGENGSGIEIGRGAHISLYHPERGHRGGGVL